MANEMKKAAPFGMKDKVGYMFGDFGNDFTFLLSSSFLMKFYTDVMRPPKQPQKRQPRWKQQRKRWTMRWKMRCWSSRSQQKPEQQRPVPDPLHDSVSLYDLLCLNQSFFCPEAGAVLLFPHEQAQGLVYHNPNHTSSIFSAFVFKL